MQDATSCPADVLGWIPWYPDQGLGEEERGAVETHAAACVRCRSELALVLGEEEAALDPVVADRIFAGALARIDAAEAGARPAAASPARAPRAPAPRRPARERGAARPRVAVAAVAALCLVVGALAVLAWPRLAEPVYTAASAPRPAGDGPLVDVVFREDASAARIGEALRRMGGEIVAGPTELGRYQVRVAAGGDPASAARELVAEGRGVALFAEPLRP